jgi:hypothetical protein
VDGGVGTQRFRARYLLIFVVTLVVAVDAGMLVRLVSGGIGDDFRVFWLASRNDPYVGGLMPFAYPPTTLLWIQPLKLIPFWLASFLWRAASVALFYFSSRRIWGSPEARFALLGPMVIYALLGGQFSLFAAALVFMAYSTRLRGLCLGLAMMLKPQMVFLAPLFLLVEKDWRGLFGLAATAVLFCGFATLAFGLQIWLDWIHAVHELQSAVNAREIDRVALSPATLYQLPAAPLFIAGIVVAAIVAFVARERSPQLKLTAVCATSLLAAPYSLRYDLAVFAPMLAGYVLQGSWRSVLASIPFTGMFGPPSLLIALLPLADAARSRRNFSPALPTRSTTS